MFEKLEDKKSNIKNERIKKGIKKFENKILENREKIIERDLGLFEKQLNRIKNKDKINEKGYDLLIKDINYLKNSI